MVISFEIFYGVERWELLLVNVELQETMTAVVA